MLAANWRLFWHDQLGTEGCPYIKRWVMDLGPLGSLRLHHWLDNDMGWYHWPNSLSYEPAAHDHPWGFLTIMLWGSYTDIAHSSSKGYLHHGIEFRDTLRAGSIRWRPAHWTHTVETSGAWTLLWTQPKQRNFGFWVKTLNGMKWIKANKFFIERHAQPPCS